ncbi:hypothetical protein K2Y00_01890 [Patescibacteria group bacterium]|nr:hypothetical protein [Patescibacteria group bacterium]
MQSPETFRSPEHMFTLFEQCEKEAESIILERNEKGEILAPNGEISELRDNELLCRIIRTSTFKNWFGDWESDSKNASTVVYESTGEPKVFFHGTPVDIPNAEGLMPDSLSDDLVYFSDLWSYAEYWGRIKTAPGKAAERSVYPCFLNIRTPRIAKVTRNGLEYDRSIAYDGIKDNFYDKTHYAVYKKEQIMHIPFTLLEQTRT